MTIYPKEQKEALIAKMLGAQNPSVAVLAKETGIPKDTLYCWRRQAQKAAGVVASSSSSAARRWSGEEKLTVVIETAALTEAELSAYCRQRGLYPEQVASWRTACCQATDEATPEAGSEQRAAQAAQAKRIKQLESELRRKEKALAEAAALLVLQKKVRALWGEIEDV